MNRVVITGATGFIGRQALDPLVAQGFEVHAITSGTPPAVSPGITWHQADLLDPTAGERLMGAIQPSHLLHFAWIATPGLYWTSPQNLQWVASSLALVRAFHEQGGRRVVVAGTCAEYDWRHGYCVEGVTPLNPATLYGTCKHALRTMLTSYAAQTGLSLAWGHIFFLYGPHESPRRLVASVITSLLRDEPARCSSGHQIRDFLHVQDVAEAFVALLASEVQGAVNIASGQPLALKAVIQRIGALLHNEAGLLLGALPTSPDDPPLLVGDVRRLTHEVGWQPRRSLDQGLIETIGWWQEHGKKNP